MEVGESLSRYRHALNVRGWVVTLALWQGWQSRHQLAVSFAIPVQTQRVDISLFVALMPGWVRLWVAAKATARNNGGSKGRGRPVEKSHSKLLLSNLAVDTRKDWLCCILATSGHDCWAAAKAARSMPVARWVGAAAAVKTMDGMKLLHAAVAAGGNLHRLAACGRLRGLLAIEAAGGKLLEWAAGGGRAGSTGGRDRVSATTLSTPGTKRMSAVNSAM